MRFYKGQKLDIGDTVVDLNRKEIIFGGTGIEYLSGRQSSVWGEYKFTNYRDFEAYSAYGNRHKLYCRVKFGTDHLLVEVVGLK